MRATRCVISLHVIVLFVTISFWVIDANYLFLYLALQLTLYATLYFFFLQGEIGRRTTGDNVLEREGYAVSAGFSLGLLALGEHS